MTIGLGEELAVRSKDLNVIGQGCYRVHTQNKVRYTHIISIERQLNELCSRACGSELYPHLHLFSKIVILLMQ